MQRETTIAILSRHRDDLRKLGVASLELFGSTARDEATLASDVDLLVEFADQPTFMGYMNLQLALEAWLGRRVDLVTTRSLAMKPEAAARVASDRVRVA